MVRITLRDGAVIDATDGHPFWIPARGMWAKAIDLNAGDRLVTADGRLVEVESLGIRVEDLTAYNLTVAGIHTYYAGQTAVLVHNCSGVDLNFGQVQERIATHVVPRHGAGTPATGTKFADDLTEDDLFSGLVERLHPSNRTGRVDEAGNHQHILNWSRAGSAGEGRVEVWMSPSGDLGGMWPIR
jgi:hypothetical protein